MRSSLCYPAPEPKTKDSTMSKRSRIQWSTGKSKRYRAAPVDHFATLPDDLIFSVFFMLTSIATSPADLFNFRITCKRMNELGQHPLVLKSASANCLAVSANKWSDLSHSFLRRCVNVGNLAACYSLGMIQFYCLENRGAGASLMARAAAGGHAAALYSLAVIQFNGTGGSKDDKNLRAGVALCSRAAFLGHVDALRELGHCLQDGYGIPQNVAAGRRLLIKANTRELDGLLSTVSANEWMKMEGGHHVGQGCPLLSDYGYELPQAKLEPVNLFLTEWFGGRGKAEGLRGCSNSGCGRPETRRSEFRRCSACGTVNYCSRACQAVHWKRAHKNECRPVIGWVIDQPVGDDAPAAAPATLVES